MYSFLKRLFDIFFSGLAILLLIPILIPVMIGLKLTGEGYVWYKQERLGINNKPFFVWKFATMLKDSASMPGGYITLRQDPRLTPMGGFLRKSKINELPQLFNIFLGQMSFVGPRPVMQISFNSYPDNVKKMIYNVKPGLTGVGSIIFRDEEQLITNEKNNGGDVQNFYTNKIYPFKGKLEIRYKKNRSFKIDLIIIFITAWVILKSDSRIYEKLLKTLPKRDF